MEYGHLPIAQITWGHRVSELGGEKVWDVRFQGLEGLYL